MAEFKIISFGFKYGEPYPEADMRIDLRNRISNPQDRLPKGAVGTDEIVKRTVLGADQNRKIFESYFERARKLARKQADVVVAFGCTSGIHRSVVFANELAERLVAAGHEAQIDHRHLKP
ncbi:MAG: RNase adapter RapZ [Roseimicrobium sp.]